MIDKSKFYSAQGQKALLIEIRNDTATCLCLHKNDRTLGADLLRIPVAELKPYTCPEIEEKYYYCKDGICCFPVPEEAPFSCLTGSCHKCFMKTWEGEDK